MQSTRLKRIVQISVILISPLLAVTGLLLYMDGTAQAQGGGPIGQNLVFNGNFEFGFYQVPELGFEPPNSGNVPKDWMWYKNQAYGKVVIDNNQRFGLTCADDLELADAISETRAAALPDPADSIFGPVPGLEGGPPPNNALALHMQSTDQQDARLGVYQVVNVVPGQSYRFSMSATIEVQAGARTGEVTGPQGTPVPQAPNHTFEIYFDQMGGTDWRAIPHQRRTIVPIKEQKLFFVIEEAEKKGEESLAEIEDYETIVTAKSDKLTIFITAWRKWANWRTAIFTVDCVSLRPINPAGSTAAAAAPAATSTPPVEVQPAAAAQSGDTSAQPQAESTTSEPLPVTGRPQPESVKQPQPEVVDDQQAEPAQSQPEAAQPQAPLEVAGAQAQSEAANSQAAPVETQAEAAPAEADSSAIIPASGGVLDGPGNSLLFMVAAALIILGLVGAGIWNMRRQ